MKIETKYNIGDKVFYLKFGIVTNGKITSIDIQVKKPLTLFRANILTRISYAINFDWIAEEKCFLSKEELLKSL